MRLLTVICVHDRPELTRRTIVSYLNTIDVDYRLAVVDNDSADGTRDVLLDLADEIDELILLDDNRYAGAAFNLAADTLTGFDASRLHFSDNDVEYLPGWCGIVDDAFRTDPSIGQLGLLEDRYEHGCTNVGNNSVIPRPVWDTGVRWPTRPWHGEIEMSAMIRRAGYTIGRVGREAILHHGWDWDTYPGYYERVAAEKSLDPGWVRTHFDRMRSL